MESLDKKDALLFTKLCAFNIEVWDIQPLIFDYKSEIYTNNWINFSALKHLDSIWLISYQSLSGYQRQWFWKHAQIFFWNDKKKSILIEFQKETWNNISTWTVLFTTAWKELAGICNPNNIDWFLEYVIEEYKKDTNILKIDIFNT